MKKSRAPDALRACAARAEELARRSPSAEEPLRFAADLYRAQAIVAERAIDLSGELDDDATALIASSAELRVRLAKMPALAEDIRSEELTSYHRARRRTGTPREFLLRAILRPYLQVLAGQWVSPPDATMRRCPFCGGPPWIAARRAASGTDGANRLLGCAWCGTEWIVNRILCPSCGEADPTKLPTFNSDEAPAVRLEACEACRSYVKSIDLTLDARPIPEVDDLCTVALDLWAGEQGFVRIEPGLAGV